MADTKILGSDNVAGECGERGERGERGPRGHDGHDGATGATGPAGPDGATGPVGPMGPTGPVAPTGPTGPAGFPPIVGAANVNSNGNFIEQTGFASSSHPAAGEYLLTLTTPPPPLPGNNGLVVVITLAGFVGGQASYLFEPPSDSGIIHVYTFDAAGVPTDKIFSIVVCNLG